MTHLDHVQLVDLLEGNAAPDAVAHADGCAQCRGELMSIRTAMAAAAIDEGPQPSPLFWDHFGQQVNRRIDATHSGWSAWIRGPRLAATLAAAVLVVLVGSGARTLFSPAAPLAPTGVAVTEPAGQGDNPADDIDADAAWAVVRTAAQDFVYEDAEAAGIAPQAGAAERAVAEMSNEERAELARLLDFEMKRTGA
jgi:hypothetical protein